METSKLIEKTIHYVWLGSAEIHGELAAYIRGWEQLHPDWQIIKWDENNFDCESNSWVKAAIEQKNYPLAADVIRSFVLLNHGGVYLDTDIELYKPLDELAAENDFFIGYETDFWFGCAVLGAKKGHRIIHEVYERYLSPCEGIGSHSNMLCVLNFSASIKRLYNIKLNGETQKIADNAKLYSTDYFFPRHYITRRTKITENTVAMHHYGSAWHPIGKRIGKKIAKCARLVLGKFFFGCFERIARINMLGKLDREYKKNKRRKNET
jgi:hypothetical protein